MVSQGLEEEKRFLQLLLWPFLAFWPSTICYSVSEQLQGGKHAKSKMKKKEIKKELEGSIEANLRPCCRLQGCLIVFVFAAIVERAGSRFSSFSQSLFGPI